MLIPFRNILFISMTCITFVFAGDDFESLRNLAESGDASAQVRLAMKYFKGADVEKDFQAAAKWFKMAAEQGDPGGQFYLGLMYKDGRAVDKDDVQAYLWLSLAHERGGGFLLVNDLIIEVKERLKPGDLQKADQLIRQWKPKQPVFRPFINPGVQGFVDRVIDSRTLLLSDSTIIGLLGLSTSGVDSQATAEAILFLRRILTGQKIKFKFYRQAIFDSANLQAYVFIDEICINEELLRRGLARVDIMTNFIGKENLLALEWKARQQKIGLWKNE